MALVLYAPSVQYVHVCTYVCASVDSVLGTQWTSVQYTLSAAPLTQSCLHTYIQSTSELRLLLHYEHTAGICYTVRSSVVHSWTDSKCLCSTEGSCIGLLYCYLCCCELMYMCVFCNVLLTLNVVATCKLNITLVYVYRSMSLYDILCVCLCVCVCAGMRPPLGPVGGEVPFLGPNLLPPFGVVPGPEGLHRPPFPGLPLPPHMGGGGVGPEDRYILCVLTHIIIKHENIHMCTHVCTRTHCICY